MQDRTLAAVGLYLLLVVALLFGDTAIVLYQQAASVASVIVCGALAVTALGLALFAPVRWRAALVQRFPWWS
jgi:hypothetical protein